MRVLRIEKPFSVSTDEHPIPKVTRGYSLLRVLGCGLCGTDLKIYRGEVEANYPIVPGHEIVGEVVESDVHPRGINVVVDPNTSCGMCESCREGKPHLCESLEATGVTRDGGFAEYVLVRDMQLYPLEGVPVERAVFAEPISCVLHGLERAGSVHVADTLVIGGGPVGCIFALLIDRFSVGKVLLAETREDRRKYLKDVVLKGSRVEIVEYPPKSRFDLVVEASGSAKGLKTAFAYLRSGGRLLIFGVLPHGDILNLKPFDIYRYEYTIVGSYINPWTMQKAVRILRDTDIAFETLVTNTCDLQELIEYIEGRKSPLMKAIYIT